AAVAAARRISPKAPAASAARRLGCPIWSLSVITPPSRSAPNHSLPSAAKLKSLMPYILLLRLSLRQIILRTMQAICVTLSFYPKAALTAARKHENRGERNGHHGG